MRSGELAELADVSVRTLRHYHQIGLLPEPARSSNGYRDYDGHDLIRVLRIRRLVDLGVRLDDVEAMLEEGGSGGTTGALAELDAALAARIEHLQARRRLLATLVVGDDVADLPPGLGAHLAALAERGFSREALRMERDQALLVHHLLGGEVSALLGEQTRSLLAGPEGAGNAALLYGEFSALDDDASEEAREAFAGRMAAALRPVLDDIGALLPTDADGRAAVLPALMDDLLTPVQRDVMARTGERLLGGGADS